jgi:hypothetical protein
MKMENNCKKSKKHPYETKLDLTMDEMVSKLRPLVYFGNYLFLFKN